MWTWILVGTTASALLYILFLKREVKKLAGEVRKLPSRSKHGGRLSLDFREQSLLKLIDALNEMADSFENKNYQTKKIEDNVKLSIVGLSHDLRTPLTAINGYVQLLRETDDEEKRNDYMTIIEQSVDRLIEMTDHFYDLAQIETNQKEMELTNFFLPNVVEECFLSYYQQFEDKDIKLEFPSETTSQQIIADRLVIQRVINNLIQNVLRYAKSQAIISYQEENEELILTIQNDIKPDSQIAIEQVFTRFYTENTSRTNTEASGLGLYLSKQFVEKMKGQMEATLNKDWFTIRLRFPTRGF